MRGQVRNLVASEYLRFTPSTDQVTSTNPTVAIFSTDTLRQMLSMAEGIKRTPLYRLSSNNVLTEYPELGSTPEAISMHGKSSFLQRSSCSDPSNHCISSTDGRLQYVYPK